MRPLGSQAPAPATVLGAALALAALSGGALAAGGCDSGGGAGGSQEGAPPARERLHARLEPLDRSGVRGRADLSLTDSTLHVSLDASGLTPDQEHVQHIHRRGEGAASACPKGPGGTGRDDRLDVEESLRVTGPVAQPLSPFPRASESGQVAFEDEFELEPGLEPLTEAVMVVYGREVDRVYDPTVPVACGQIR